MSAKSQRSGPSSESVIIAAVVILALAGVWYLSSQRQQALRASPAGMEGLAAWLNAQGTEAQSFSGGWLIDATTLGVMVIPVYDTRLDQDREPPRSQEELLLQQDEYDLEAWVIREKAERVQTLVVLPKWRSGMRLTGLGHPVLLSERTRVQSVLRTVTGVGEARLHSPERPFSEFRYDATGGDAMRAEIYAAQTISVPGCETLIGTQERGLLLDCPLDRAAEGTRVLILSDPDLFSNHGLRLGQNAEIAHDFLSSRAHGKRILVDYSVRSWLADAESEETRERTWSDLLRFFEHPFRILWIGAALTLALFVWRASFRDGPIQGLLRPQEASKAQTIRAHARLLRLTDQDGAMIADYASARIATTAARLFGPAHARHFGDEAAFLRFARRRNPGLANGLEQRLADLRALPARMPAAEAIAHVDDFEELLEALADDA